MGNGHHKSFPGVHRVLAEELGDLSATRPILAGIYRHPPSDLSYLPVNKRIPCVVSHPVCSDLFSQSTIFHVQNHATSFAYEFLLKMVEQKPYFRGFPIAGSHKKISNFPSIFPAGQEDVEAQIQAEHDARLAAEEVLLIGFLLGTSFCGRSEDLWCLECLLFVWWFLLPHVHIHICSLFKMDEQCGTRGICRKLCLDVTARREGC